ncbi:MAG: hypothetical protein JWP78_3728 [Mucilaginibacter sp.]|nr:hypothetical protein [Mucilaginibacter sp.]
MGLLLLYMNYEDAIVVVKKYQYLLNKEIIEKSTGKKWKVDYITILPSEGIQVYTNDWFYPLKEVFAKYLSDKDCTVNFIVDFSKATSSGVSIREEQIAGNYLLPESNEP